MILPSSIPSIPAGVKVKSDVILDEVRETEFRLNESAKFMVSQINGRNSVGSICKLCAQFYDMKRDVFLDDAVILLKRLNDCLLVNIHTPARLRLLALYFIVKHQAFTEFTLSNKRIDILDSDSYLDSFLLINSNVLYRLLPLLLVMFLIPMVIFSVSLFISVRLVLWMAVYALGIGTSIAMHEWGHLVVHRALTKRKSLFLLVSGFNFGLQRQRLSVGDEYWIALAGPVLVFCLGLFLLMFFIVTGSMSVLGLSFIFLIHVLCFLPFSSDGEKVFLPLKTYSQMKGGIMGRLIMVGGSVGMITGVLLTFLAITGMTFYGLITGAQNIILGTSGSVFYFTMGESGEFSIKFGAGVLWLALIIAGIYLMLHIIVGTWLAKRVVAKEKQA